MVAFIETDPSRKLSLGDYLALTEREVVSNDFSSVAESAWALRALANDRNFVLDKYHEELKRHWEGTSENENLPQSIVFAKTKDFYVRSNIWLPIQASGVQKEFQQALYSYEMPHDHNFHFVTVGYFGPGYQTNLYRYDRDKVQGYEGEAVDIEECGMEQLTPGRTMVYEAGRDIHTQREPEAVSVSLNLMCRPTHMTETPQFIFDVSTGRIAKGAGDLVSTRLLLLEFFRHVHDEDTVQLLADIAVDHRCVRTRAHALNILRDVRPDEGDFFEAKATLDAIALSKRTLAFGSGTRDHVTA